MAENRPDAAGAEARTSNPTRVERPYPRKPLEHALRVPRAIKEHNGGNPWRSDQVAEALGVGAKTGNFFYITAAARDFGLTEGTRDTAQISLTDLGRKAVYPSSAEEERSALIEAFLSVEIFSRVLDHFGGNSLPEKRFLTNTLHQTFGLDPSVHDEFVEMFDKNCRFLGIGRDLSSLQSRHDSPSDTSLAGDSDSPASVTVASPTADAPVCFVVMPFVERDDRHATGFFEEVLSHLLAPAIAGAGFAAKTAKRQGSDVIQSTIVNDLLEADLVVADLTEHNPNVLFEIGMRMAEDKPIALIRAKGTGPIFDVDNMLRVEEYHPNLWKSTLQKDIPRIQAHIEATWNNRETVATFMKILRQQS